ncbi:uncharacterized protein EDB91DRAFT_1247069 [Suillus paluster]|uniref:uncharacterized protein n=1 Tax=Suillus paluster TaxID=48578 RepID=UPI001B86FC27|nr:uncharacterized protein EDB91DRAFT_1247069 [Suillus paluster]KAG1743570.1 hypothetical protein EDB91DRAFT_1247069 [Suillus paluster]
MAISAALQEAGTGQNVTEEPIDNDSAASTLATMDIPVPVPHDAASPITTASPSTAATETTAPVIVITDSDDEDAFPHDAASPTTTANTSTATTETTAPVTVVMDSNDEDASNAAESLAQDSTLHSYSSKYFNVPIKDKAPLYYVMWGRYIGIFSGWDVTSPKVTGVSPAIFHKVDSVEQGIRIVKCTIERGEVVQVA